VREGESERGRESELEKERGGEREKKREIGERREKRERREATYGRWVKINQSLC